MIALDEHGVSATLFYLAVYGFSTLSAFATISVVREPDRPVGPHLSGREATDISQWAGLGKRYPLVGAMFSMFLLAFAGIPLTSGFIAKFAVFSAAAGSGARRSGGDRRALQCHRRLLLHPHHHRDVLHRPT